MLGAFDPSTCTALATQETSQFDAMIHNIGQTWHPTGSYDPQDMETVINAMNGLLGQMNTAISNMQNSIASSFALDPSVTAGTSSDGHAVDSTVLFQNCKNAFTAMQVMGQSGGCDIGVAQVIDRAGVLQNLWQAQDDIAKAALQGANYDIAIVTAIAQQGQVDDPQTQVVVGAPLFKDWVLWTLNAVSSAANAISIAKCLISHVPSLDSMIASAFGAVVDAAKAVIGVIVTAVTQVVKAAEDVIGGLVGFTGFILKYGLWIGLGLVAAVGAYFAWPKIKQARAALLERRSRG